MEIKLDLAARVQLRLKTAGWELFNQSNLNILNNKKAFKLGWQRIVLLAKNDDALKLVSNTSTVSLKQNDHLNGVPLHAESERKLSLVFYRHSPLKKLTLEWLFNTDDLTEQPLFSVRIKPISATKAWFFMLQQVSRKHKKTGQTQSNIYRLTRARQKRNGGSHALYKLVQEYQPLLCYQLKSCEPYQFWRLHIEPDANELLCNGAANAMLLPLEPKQKQFEDNAFYYCQQKDSIYSRSFEKVVKSAVTQHTDAKVIYWDHDYLDEYDQRIQPHFKPSWNPDLFRSQDYVGNCFAVKGQVLNQIKDSITDSRNLLLVLLSKGLINDSDEDIVHLPAVLQHVKKTKQANDSTSDVLERIGLITAWAKRKAEFIKNIESGLLEGTYKVNYRLNPPAKAPMVSIIIPTKDALNLTKNCINSVLSKSNYEHYEILLVNNQSQQQATLEWLHGIAQHPKVNVLNYDKPFNYSAINNFAVSHANGDVICLLNNDTEVISPDWISEMLQHALRPDIGCVGAKLYYPDDTIQHAGVIMGLWGLAGHGHKNFLRYADGYCQRLQCVQNYSAVTAACLMVRKDVYHQVKGLNEQELTVAFNDVDFCLKVKAAGYRNLWTPYAELYHYESKSRGREDTPEKKQREANEIEYMRQHWHREIENDLHYSVHLTRENENFGFQMTKIKSLE
ncbi:glycosyltransferase family 2 protein [Idiomarina sp.]|uniref:glycosyltransferase family 2 protein n=1 Tax=Idiomarina sp. TaxID=1874361 RepID=UPI0025BDA75C|nr:glycosyltransferase family 2 protein [Idiomarina sp.]